MASIPNSASSPAPLEQPHDADTSVAQQELLDKLHVERAIADGAENLLAVFQAEDRPTAEGASSGGKGELKAQVEVELQGARNRIQELEEQLLQLGWYEQEQASSGKLQPSYAPDAPLLTASAWPAASPSQNGHGTSNGVHSPNSVASSEYYHYAASTSALSSNAPLSPALPPSSASGGLLDVPRW